MGPERGGQLLGRCCGGPNGVKRQAKDRKRKGSNWEKITSSSYHSRGETLERTNVYYVKGLRHQSFTIKRSKAVAGVWVKAFKPRSQKETCKMLKGIPVSRGLIKVKEKSPRRNTPNQFPNSNAAGAKEKYHAENPTAKPETHLLAKLPKNKASL